MTGAGRLFGRDGVVTVSVIVSFLVALLPLFNWSTETVGAVTAALVALGGFVSAALVSVDRALPGLVGLGQAVIAAVLSFGVHLSDNHVAAAMAVLTVIAGLATRPQVSAKQPARDRDGNVIHPSGYATAVLDRITDLGSGVPPAPETGSERPGGAHFATEVIPSVKSEPGSGYQERERQAPRHRHTLWDDASGTLGAT